MHWEELDSMANVTEEAMYNESKSSIYIGVGNMHKKSEAMYSRQAFPHLSSTGIITAGTP